MMHEEDIAQIGMLIMFVGGLILGLCLGFLIF
jgi:hypothetical protein